jgi:cytoskeleton protein RodZ
VFEIGNSLREARVRRGLDFAQAELTTKIRGKYLRALEEEHFELLPAETYVKGFLRTYAEYLGLDGQLYVDEFNSRFVTGEESAARAAARTRRSNARPQRRNRRTETAVVLAVLAAIAVFTVVIISAFTTGGGKPHTRTSAKKAAAAPHVVPALLTVRALRGATHLTARKSSASGAIRYDGTVETSDGDVSIRGSKLWVQIDSPENLRIKIRGKLVHVPGLRPRVILVTATGWRPL